MKRVTVAILVAVCAACTGDVGNPDEALQMDPRIYHTWVSVTGDDTLRSTPIVVNGLRINTDNTIDNFAAETLTGVLKAWDSGYKTQVTRTSAGKMFLTTRALGRNYNYNVSYSVSDTLLRISSAPDVWYALPEGTYERGTAGLQVATPVPSHFSFQLNGGGHNATVVEPADVSPTAGGFASFINDEETQLQVTTMRGDVVLKLVANGFVADGNYKFSSPDSSWAEFVEASDSLSLDLVSIVDRGAGSVKITSFDRASGRCVGTFTVALSDSSDGNAVMFVSNGSFDVPLYEEP